jgi:hypothetical protein
MPKCVWTRGIKRWAETILTLQQICIGPSSALPVSVGGSFLQLNERASFEVYVETFPSPGLGKRQISSGGGTKPVWSRDGMELTIWARMENGWPWT